MSARGYSVSLVRPKASKLTPSDRRKYIDTLSGKHAACVLYSQPLCAIIWRGNKDEHRQAAT